MVHLFRFVFAVFTTAFRGFVGTKLWTWFMVSAFGLPYINTVQAIGLTLVVSLFSPWKSYTDKDLEEAKETSPSAQLISTLIHLLTASIILLMGWLVHMLMA
jgi:hypothetical protein